MTQDLRSRWRRFVDQHAAAQHLADSIFDELARRYDDPRRAYHNLGHLEHCFAELEEARLHPAFVGRDLGAAEYALWLHDAVYQPFSSQNERHSAQLASELGERLGLPSSMIATAARCIEGTRAHAATDDVDEQFVYDCDLAILGQAGPRFALYQRQVRQEYRWLPDWYYARRRRAFIEALLARPTIFQSEPFRGRYERQARANLAAAAHDLAPGEHRLPKVVFDEDAVWTTVAGALRDRLSWAQLERIVIVTTDAGPYADDVHWILFGGGDGCVFGSETEGAAALVDRLIGLPGFRHEEFIRAMGSVTGASFNVWERGATKEPA